MEEMKALLHELCAAEGVSGDEKAIAEICRAHLSKYADVSTDALGNIIGEIPGNGTHILLDAHMDSIGLIVTGIDKTGFLRVAPVGGMDARIMAAAELTVYGREKLYGVIASTPPHLAGGDGSDAKDFDKLSVDLGLPYDEVIKIVSPGDRVSVNGAFRELLDGRVSAGALDDRAGIAVILCALEKLSEKKHNCKITAVFSSREEVGGSGAATAAYASAPDEAIVVDVSFAMAPGLSETEASPLGGGPIIAYAPVLSFGMCDKLKDIAIKNNIPYSVEVGGGKSGSNADEILVSGKGVKTAALFVPLRNMHSAVEIIDVDDMEHTAELITQYIVGMQK